LAPWWALCEGPAAASHGISAEAAKAKYFPPARRNVVFISILFVFGAGRMFSGRSAGRPEGRHYVDGFAYVKIEARILARTQCGKVSRFVLFAADIPSIVEPFGAGASAGKYSLAGSAGLAETCAFFRLAICECCHGTKNLTARAQ
jgi:hypothetical protein